MLDLETLSTKYNASILVIAGIKFNRNDINKPLSELDTFYKRITIQSCEDLKLDVDPKTLQWWDTQDPKIKYESVLHPDRIPIKKALQEFSKWYGNSTHIWCNGANFDAPILDNAYTSLGLKTPWKFWSVRDTRTLYELAGITTKDLPNKEKHNALSDCYAQIYGVQQSLRILSNYQN